MAILGSLRKSRGKLPQPAAGPPVADLFDPPTTANGRPAWAARSDQPAAVSADPTAPTDRYRSDHEVPAAMLPPDMPPAGWCQVCGRGGVVWIDRYQHAPHCADCGDAASLALVERILVLLADVAGGFYWADLAEVGHPDCPWRRWLKNAVRRANRKQ